MSIDALLKKSFSVIKYEGVNSFAKKSVKYSMKKLLRRNSAKHIAFKDILFINGCTLPHPQRYRVDHQIEQLHFNGYSCDTVYYEDLTVDMVRYYRSFVFFRCPHTEVVEDLIKKAKYFNKTVIFDIDDLVIDYKYVKQIKHLETMSTHEMEMYMDGVNRTQKTLSMCDYAITTTARLANELRPYVKEVYINRNVASEKMIELSIQATKNKNNDESRVVLGYFSGSITHNEDFDLILPVIKNIFTKNKNVYLKIVGFLDLPDQLKEFEERILFEKFTDWKNLPGLIASVDINLAPLVSSIFNEAKSENKWMEAALVKVPTIASNVGAFKEVVKNKETGILCDGYEEWESQLTELINSREYRCEIAKKAFDEVILNWTTAKTGYKLYDFIETHSNPNIAFVLPSTQISGGVNVVIKHCNILRDSGKDVTIISMSEEDDNIINNDGEINVISYHRHAFHGYFEKCVATLWSTTSFLNNYPKIKDKYYLVQNFETDFYEPGNYSRILANLTYTSYNDMNYITISKWCEKWLKEDFNRKVTFAPNGIDLSIFKFNKKDFDFSKNKVRVLVEGNSKDHYKNVDESFEIVNSLDKEKFEIWYLSYSGAPKEWYKVDKFLNKVPYDEVGGIYAQCDILIKSSLLESFSYPPLEMMATGGIAIVAPNAGNIEYLRHEENCLLYEQGNVNNAIEMIHKVYESYELRERLVVNGLKTAEDRQWNSLENEILGLYGYKDLINETYGEYYEKIEMA
ncbi:glycosyltransferase [Paenibacillus sp. NPDC058367]|uniref:glycosyltransferase n=1 Tax=Paenibacillus sp. NPDC058367 TaxID=3346460 RepID=UPI00365450E8